MKQRWKHIYTHDIEEVENTAASSAGGEGTSKMVMKPGVAPAIWVLCFRKESAALKKKLEDDWKIMFKVARLPRLTLKAGALAGGLLGGVVGMAVGAALPDEAGPIFAGAAGAAAGAVLFGLFGTMATKKRWKFPRHALVLCCRKTLWGINPYFSNYYCLLNLLIFTVMWVIFALHVVVHFKAQAIDWNARDAWVDIAWLALTMRVKTYLVAWTLFACCFKTLSHIFLHAQLAIPIIVIGGMLKKLSTFFVIFFLFLLAFSLFNSIARPRFCRTLFFRSNALHCHATARILILA